MGTPQALYPRAKVLLSASIDGKDFDTTAIPISVSLTRKQHTHADECTITLTGTGFAAGVRAMTAGVASVYLSEAGSTDGQADDGGTKNLRFMGPIDAPDGELSDRMPSVKLVCRDYSAVLRAAKPVPVAGIPRYSDTVGQALQRVLDSVPGGDAITIRDSPILADTLAGLVGKRASSGFIEVKSAETTAWEVIEQVCNMASLPAPQFDLNEMVLYRPEEQFGDPGKPDRSKPVATFIYGGDNATVSSLTMKKHFLRQRKGLRLIGFDPVAHKTLTADYPPDNELPPRALPKAVRGGKSSTKHRSQKTKPAAKEPERDVIKAPHIHTLDALRTYAERAWRERAMQEMEGELITPVWTNDLLAIRPGDRILIVANPETEAEVRNASSVETAARFLVARFEIAKDFAVALAQAIRNRKSDLFIVNQIQFDWHASGNATARISFANLIVVEEAA